MLCELYDTLILIYRPLNKRYHGLVYIQSFINLSTLI